MLWAAMLLAGAGALPVLAQESPSTLPTPSQAPPPAEETQEQVPPPASAAVMPPAVPYDKAIFKGTLRAAQLAGLSQLAGAPAKDAMRDKQFKKALKEFVPGSMFHYGRDMPLREALDLVLEDSRAPVQLREGRYLLVPGASGPYLRGRAFVWLDLQEGIGLAGFYFHPTNGEPTPTLVVASRQVKEQTLEMGQLPPAFAEDLAQWSAGAGVPQITTRYFITGLDKRILLQHDEDYCAAYGPGAAAVTSADCMESNAEAAEIDVTAAYYLDQIHYATNGTAWMIGPDQQAWIVLRNSTCGGLADPFACRIRMARQRTVVILHRSRR